MFQSAWAPLRLCHSSGEEAAKVLQAASDRSSRCFLHKADQGHGYSSHTCLKTTGYLNQTVSAAL